MSAACIAGVGGGVLLWAVRKRGAIDIEKQKRSGTSALNTKYQKYEEVEKPQYHLSEKSCDQFDDEFQFTTVDMQKCIHGDKHQRQEFAEELGKALEEVGFAILIGHEVPLEVLQQSHPQINRFFGRSNADKMCFRAEREGSVNQGYFPIKETSNIHPDLVEGWVFCRRAFNFDGKMSTEQLQKFWPDLSDEPYFRRYVLGLETLMLPVMHAVLSYLGCDPHLYDDRLKGTNFGLRLNYYPPVSDADQATGAGRMLGHEDMDLFTFLPAPAQEGLQVRHRKTGKWMRMRAPEGSIILNTGDYLQRISNDRLPSTTHRVSVPRKARKQGETAARVASTVRTSTVRTSMPLAIYLWENEPLECLPGVGKPKYPPISAIDFHTRVMSKYYGDDYRSTGTDKAM
jgi:isopenicillin N synthase-like dioxygenase